MSKAFQTIKRFQSYFGLIIIFLIAVVFSPQVNGHNTFLSATNLTDILRASSIIGIMALAMTFVITTAGIDLSVGSILALSTCVLALMLKKWMPATVPSAKAVEGGFHSIGVSFEPLPHIIIAVLVALVASTIVGALSGTIISKLKVQPFIATLATMIGIRGFTKWLSGNATMDIGFGKNTPAIFADFASQKTVMIGTYAVLAAVFAFIFSRTVFGRHVRAVGDNEKAAKYSGLPIGKIKIWVYTLSGLLCGIAGILFAAQTNQSDPNAGVGYELDVITAVVLGGTSLAGGKGSVVGTIIGTLIIGVLTNILGLKNIDANVQMMVKAVIIILAVWMQKRERAD